MMTGDTQRVAISLWQPWATLIAIGAKQHETRGWSTKHRGRILIHASKRWTTSLTVVSTSDRFRQALERASVTFTPTSRAPGCGLPLGAFVAEAELVQVIPTEDVDVAPDADERYFGDFSPGRFAWRLANVHRLAVPVPYCGRQGLFRVPSDVLSLEMTPHD